MDKLRASGTSYLRRIAALSVSHKTIVFLILGNVVFWTSIAIGHGQNLDSYFYTADGRYFGKDFFVCLASVGWGDPWIDSKLNYPAGAILFVKLFHRLLPPQYGHTDSFDTIASVTNDMQNLFAPTTAFLLLTLLSATALAFYIHEQSKECGRWKFVLIAGLILSGPSLAAFRSGNIALLSFAFLFFYLLVYKSEKKWIRYFGYISLGIASTIKLYPALFALLILKGSNKREFVPCCLICAFLILAPFFCFDGIGSINAFISTFFADSSRKSDWGVGTNYSFQNFIKLVSALFGSYIQGDLPIVIRIGAFIGMLALFSISKEPWQQCFFLVMCCYIGINYVGSYMLFLLVPSLILLLNDRNNCGREDGSKHSSVKHTLPLVSLIIVFVPFDLPMVEYVNSAIHQVSQQLIFPLGAAQVIINFAIFFTFLVAAFQVLSGKCNERLRPD